jgi:phage shock protein PspC (stress-responsive transcriptional regulator)
MDLEKKLLRPRDGVMIAGVCAAFARYFGVDVTLVRLGWVFLVILLGTGLLAYLICWIVIPQEDLA